MRKHTHQRVYFYKCCGDFCVYTARPKRKPTWADTVPGVEGHRKTIKAAHKRHKREQALIDRLFAAAKENENRPYEEHKKLVERQVERIQEMFRLHIYPKLWI